MGRDRGKRDKSKNVDEVESARLVKHSYQLRRPTHSSKAGVGKLFVRRATFEKNVAAEGRTLSLQSRKVYS